MNIADIIDWLYLTYPAVPFISTGPLILLAIAITPLYLLFMIGAIIVGRIQRGTPIPWDYTDTTYLDNVPGVMTPEQEAENLRKIERGKAARAKRRELEAYLAPKKGASPP